jgi:hypothetical protein
MYAPGKTRDPKMRIWMLGIMAALVISAALGCGARMDTPLAVAAAGGNTAEIERLVAAGAAIDGTDSRQCLGCTALVAAARSGQVEAIQTLLKLGANAETTDRGINGWTALLHAIHKNQLGAVRALLDGGADPDHPVDEHQVTALMMAAGYGYTSIVELLLEKGANPRKATPGGYNALAAAVRGLPDIDRFTVGKCQTNTVKALLTAAPDLKLPDNSFGKTARWASWIGRCAEVEKLVTGAESQSR